jgi:hypothetical protein
MQGTYGVPEASLIIPFLVVGVTVFPCIFRLFLHFFLDSNTPQYYAERLPLTGHSTPLEKRGIPFNITPTRTLNVSISTRLVSLIPALG